MECAPMREPSFCRISTSTKRQRSRISARCRYAPVGLPPDTRACGNSCASPHWSTRASVLDGILKLYI